MIVEIYNTIQFFDYKQKEKCLNTRTKQLKYAHKKKH